MLFGSGLSRMNSKLNFGHQIYSNLDSSGLRLDFHGGGGCTCKSSDVQVMTAKGTRYSV